MNPLSIFSTALQFPSAEFLSRDRASAYASAATECGKTQIADRFHWVKNAHVVVEEALMTSIPATIFIRSRGGRLGSDHAV